MKRAGHPDDLTMRYMQRFGCIGEKCEDNCCHSWTVSIDDATLKRMKQVTSMHSEKERKFWVGSLHQVEMEKGKKVTAMRLRPDGRCPMLEDSGLCHVQGTFGEKLLSDTCAVYPRRIQKVGEALELSGMASCPEMSRQLLLHEDACEPARLDRNSIFRIVLAQGMDPRDIRPYWRLLVKVRTFMINLLRRPGFTLEQRLFFMTWFAKRASPILNKSTMKADTAAVLAEMSQLETDEMLGELARRFDAAEASSAVTLVLARELVRRRMERPGARRSSFSLVVDKIFHEYQSVRAFLPGDLEGEDAGSHATRLYEAYLERRKLVMDRARARVDQYLVNIAHNYWMHRLPLEAPDLMVHMLRLLALMSVLKFLIFSHPTVQAGGDDHQTRLDAAAVEVVYTTARYIEHGPLLTDMENALEGMGLRSLAGAIYLIRF